jgi:starch synthase
MQIIYIASEMEPYCKVGGLGDVMGTLPKKISGKGPDVKVIIPDYGVIDHDKYNINSYFDYFLIDIAGKKYKCKVSRLAPAKENYEILLIGNDELFDRPGIYTDSNGDAYKDNLLRFLFFQRAALQYLSKSDLQPDIIHCHDNQTALIPVYLKYKFPKSQVFINSKTILTLHNIGYQGITDFHNKKYMELPEKLFNPCALLEWYGQINPLKAGILSADKVTTVSEEHAREISNNERLSAGLMPVIKSRKDEIIGILNGVDYDQWNPETDEYISVNYSLADFAGKKENKVSILKEMDFPDENSKIPLIGMVSRLVEQKGIELIIDKMESILSFNVRMVILGSGSEKFHLELKKFAQKYPSRLKIYFSYNIPLSHRIIAGSDILLMPSRYEPCGITQMLAMQYGTVPVAHKTGGLADTITDMQTGFLFDKYDSQAMVNAIDRALQVYKKQAQWEDLMINGMNSDFSWDNSVNEYFSLYTEIIGKK